MPEPEPHERTAVSADEAARAAKRRRAMANPRLRAMANRTWATPEQSLSTSIEMLGRYGYPDKRVYDRVSSLKTLGVEDEFFGRASRGFGMPFVHRCRAGRTAAAFRRPGFATCYGPS